VSDAVSSANLPLPITTWLAVTREQRGNVELVRGSNERIADSESTHLSQLALSAVVSDRNDSRGLAPRRQCLVHVSSFQDPKTAYVLLGLQVRPVGDAHFTRGLPIAAASRRWKHRATHYKHEAQYLLLAVIIFLQQGRPEGARVINCQSKWHG
jgi:hypothetical protein